MFGKFILISLLAVGLLADASDHIAPEGTTLRTRFLPPEGYTRIEADAASFAFYLQNLPLKPHQTQVKYYDGSFKNKTGVYVAVVDMEIGTENLQQCADAIMRLRAEYLYKQKQYSQIHFRFTNGDNAEYVKYAEGYRATIQGNKVTWKKTASKDYGYATFRKYMNLVFMYAGTLSLSKELVSVPILPSIQIGDVFIRGGSPGHAVLVVDMVRHNQTGKKLFLLAQSYMPAQDIQILENPMNADLNPWYAAEFTGMLETPEWTFEKTQLKRF